MAAQSEGRLVEMFGAGTAAVVSICPHDLSNISFISIFIRILFCHFKNYALLMRPKVLLMWCCWNSSSVSTKWQKVGLNEQEVTVAPTHIHIHIYTFTYICIQNFGEYSDPLPSHPPKKSKYKKGIWVCFSIILLHTLSKETFGIASSESPPKQSFFQQLMSQTCREPCSKVTRIFNCVAALGKTGNDSDLKIIYDLFPFLVICDIYVTFESFSFSCDRVWLKSE